MLQLTMAIGPNQLIHMKSIRIISYPKYLLLTCLCLVGMLSYATEYTTVQDGAWDDAATWVGGVAPNNQPTDGDVFHIGHHVTRDANSYFPASIHITTDGTFENKNDIQLKGDVSVESGGTFVNSGKLTITDGTFTIDQNGVMNIKSLVTDDGTFTVEGVLNVIEETILKSKLVVTNSGLVNFGIGDDYEVDTDDDDSSGYTLNLNNSNADLDITNEGVVNVCGNSQLRGVEINNALMVCYGDAERVNGSSTADLQNNATMVVFGNMGGEEIYVDESSQLSVLGNYDAYGTVSIDGDFAVGGDFNKSGSQDIEIGDDGDIVILGDFAIMNSNDEITLIGAGTISVLGSIGNEQLMDFIVCDEDGNNCTTTTVGSWSPREFPDNFQDISEMLGDNSNVGAELPSGSFVFDIVAGLHVIFSESDAEESSTPEEIEYGGSSYYVVWESETVSSGCYRTVGIMAYVEDTDNTILQYSSNDGNTWTDYTSVADFETVASSGLQRANEIETSQIKLRVISTDSSEDIGVVVVYGGTLDGTTNTPVIIQLDGDMSFCESAIKTFELSGGPYTDILWEVISDGTIIGANYEEEVTIQWTGYGQLKVSASNGSSCGSSTAVFSMQEADQLSVTLVEHADITCNDSDDGKLEVKHGCGESSNYTYTWTTTSSTDVSGWTTGGPFENLTEGTYTVKIETTASAAVQEEATETFTIIEPEEVETNFGENVLLLCSSSEKGVIIAEPYGGTPPYKVRVQGTATTNYDQTIDDQTFKFDNLEDDVYTITITDANNCQNTASYERQVVRDTETPTFETFPENYYMSYDDYADLVPSSPTVISTDDYTFTPNGLNITMNGSNITFGYPIGGSGPINENVYTTIGDLSNIAKLVFSFDVKQINSSTVAPFTWSGDDYFKVEFSYDGVNWADSLTDPSVFNGTTVDEGDDQQGNETLIPVEFTIDQNTLRDAGTSSVTIRLSYATHVEGNHYEVENFEITSLAREYGVDETTSGEPSVSDDVDSSPDLSYSDSFDWGSCDESSANPEFRITRTWRVEDDCGKAISKDQYINVGEAPAINEATEHNDTIVDFCHNTITFTPIVFEDACGNLGDLECIIVNESGADTLFHELNFGSVSYEFTPSLDHDTIYHVRWKQWDHLGFVSDIYEHDVTVKQPITFTIANDNIDPDPTDDTSEGADFCSNESTIFYVNDIEGGSGSDYIISYQTSPALVTIVDTVDNSGVFEEYDDGYVDRLTQARWLDIVNCAVTVTVADVDHPDANGIIGGCSTVITSGELKVHGIIQTQPIDRGNP